MENMSLKWLLDDDLHAAFLEEQALSDYLQVLRDENKIYETHPERNNPGILKIMWGLGSQLATHKKPNSIWLARKRKRPHSQIHGRSPKAGILPRHPKKTGR